MRKYDPLYFVDSVFNIDFLILKNLGKRAILIDIDNTIVPFKEALPSDAIINFIDEGKASGLRFCIVSNTYYSRVSRIGLALGIPFVHMAKKPLKGGIKKGLNLLNADNEEALLIGDQFCTDILAAKNAGIDSILVEPITKSDIILTKFYRGIEYFFKKSLKKENMK